MQTENDRIYQHYKSKRNRERRHQVTRGNGYPSIWMSLAQRWKKPIHDIKVIVKEKKEEADASRH